MLSPAWVLLMQSQVWPGLSLFCLFLHWFNWRCGIPVVVMGETGCGKTCLIRYMCGLQSGPGGPKNMLLMKVEICSLLFVCGWVWVCVCVGGGGERGGGVGVREIPYLFFSPLPFLFRSSAERRRSFGGRICPPKRWHLWAWAAKGFLWCNTFCFVVYHSEKNNRVTVWVTPVRPRALASLGICREF